MFSSFVHRIWHTPKESGRFAEVTVVEISFQTDLPYGLAYFSEELHILKKGLASL